MIPDRTATTLVLLLVDDVDELLRRLPPEVLVVPPAPELRGQYSRVIWLDEHDVGAFASLDDLLAELSRLVAQAAARGETLAVCGIPHRVEDQPPSSTGAPFPEPAEEDSLWLSDEPDDLPRTAAPPTGPEPTPPAPPPPPVPAPSTSSPGSPRSPRSPDSAGPSAPADTGAEVDQTVRVQTVTVLRPGESAGVSVTLAGGRLAAAGDNTALGAFRHTPGVALQLIARCTGPLQLVGEPTRSVLSQAAGSRTGADFEVRATGPGAGSVTVAVVGGTTDLAEISLTIQVSADARDDGQTQAREGTAAATAARARNQLRIYRDGGGLLCGLTLPRHYNGRVHRLALPDPGPQLRAIQAALGSAPAAAIAHGPAREAELEGLGATIAQTFLTRELAEVLWEVRDEIDHLEVLSDEPNVPWELCTFRDGDGRLARDRAFFGERGLTRVFPGWRRRPSVLRVAPQRSWLVTPTLSDPRWALPVAIAEGLRLARRHGWQRLDPVTLASVHELLAGGEADLVHYIGHGSADLDNPAASRLLVEDARDPGAEPTGFTAAMLGRPFAGHPMVFLNACESGRLGPGLGGFAQRVMAAGGSAFVGTQWQVEDGPAAQVADGLYEALLGEGLTLSAAAARVRARGSAWWSATPLAYAIYGDADLRLEEARS